MTSRLGPSAAHPAVAAYVARHGIDAAAFRPDGRLTLRVDGRYRVHLRPAADGRIALSARLLDLGERPASDADDLLQRLALLATGLLREQAAGLCVDESAGALLLQQWLAMDTDADGLEEQLAEYVNALAFWTRACASDTAGRPS